MNNEDSKRPANDSRFERGVILEYAGIFLMVISPMVVALAFSGKPFIGGTCMIVSVLGCGLVSARGRDLQDSATPGKP